MIARTIISDSLRPIAVFLDDPAVNEVMVNGNGAVFVEKSGVIARAQTGAVPLNLSPDMTMMAIRALASTMGREIRSGGENQILDANYDDLRIAAAVPPVSPDGPSMSIRKHSRREMTFDDYIRDGTMTQPQANYLAGVVHEGHHSILISGGTSTGKTTFLNALAKHIPDDARVLTVEDTLELNITVPDLSRFRTDARNGFTYRRLVQHCMRSRPDRVIAGELRGAEAFDVLDAMNTGHGGIMTTIHANDAHMALIRMSSLVAMGLPEGSNWTIETIRDFIGQLVGVVVSVVRINGVRRVNEIVHVKGYENGKFQFEKT